MMKSSATLIVLFLYVQLVYTRRMPLFANADEIDPDPNEVNAPAFTPSSWLRFSAEPPQTVTKMAGSTIEILCEATGAPAPTVEWLKDNRPLAEKEEFESNLINDTPPRGLAKVRSVLVIRRALPSHNGEYTCIADNANHVVSTKTKVSVTPNPSLDANVNPMRMNPFFAGNYAPKILHYYTFLMNDIGNTINLPCKAIGLPSPTIIWLNNNDEIVEPDNHISLLPDGTLRIRDLRWVHMGPYRCVASNGLGQDSVTTFLYPMMAGK